MRLWGLCCGKSLLRRLGGNAQAAAQRSRGFSGISGEVVIPGDRTLPTDPDARRAAILVRMSNLANAFRHRGHFAARLDPLRGSAHKKLHDHEPLYWIDPDQIDVCRLLKNYPESLDLTAFGLQDVPLDERFPLGYEFKLVDQDSWSIREVVEYMRLCFCGTTAVEYTHVSDVTERNWLKTVFESRKNVGMPTTGLERRGGSLNPLSRDQQKQVLDLLIRSDHLERFLGSKFPAVKRFGVEGAEALLPGLHFLIERASQLGVEGVEIGMAHRGRLNVLTTLFGKPLGSIVNEFREEEEMVADVKYHLGTYSEVLFGDRRVHMSLAANPSHLEAVNGVVVGKTRAKQFFIGDSSHERVLAVLLHGDAAFSGQGIVPEVMELSDIPAYTTGGTVHVIINNMIGFTTNPRASRSSYHCTDVAKGIQAPIFHVNGDDVEAVVSVCQLAAEYRQTFHKDCVVDIVCYRRHGHNELDEPSLTQPLTYALIAEHPPVVQIYTEALIEAGVVDAETAKGMSQRVLDEYEDQNKTAKECISKPEDWLASNWQGDAINALTDAGNRPFNPTGVKIKTLEMIARAMNRIPDDFTAHPTVVKLFQDRDKQIEGNSLDMAQAELLAFGSLMLPYKDSKGETVTQIGRIKRPHGDDAEEPEQAAQPFWTEPERGEQEWGGCNPEARKSSNSGTLELMPNSISERTLWETSDALKSTTADSVLQYNEHPTVHVRLSGQDSERGTFNQRHAVIYDQRNNLPYTPLNNLGMGPQATFQICNSSLSEAAVLAFEYGYSLESDLALTVWEAQFGDFANVAQHIIDNFIATGEWKWGQKSGLVMLLPHGFEGQGPEHSSARLERFLNLIDDDPELVPGTGEAFVQELERGFNTLDKDGSGRVRVNELANFLSSVAPEGSNSAHQENYVLELGGGNSSLTFDEYKKFAAGWARRNLERTHNLCVVNCTTPAQYFHALRRQIHRPYVKPLIMMSPKYMLHHRACRSTLEDMAPGTYFFRVIIEGDAGDNMAKREYSIVQNSEVRRVVFVSGKLFYELWHSRAQRKIRDVAFVRLEQIAPFPFDRMARAAQQFPNAELVWAQEEPKNMGAYSYVAPRFKTALEELNGDTKRRIVCKARPVAAAATGLFRNHISELKQLLDDVLVIDKEDGEGQGEGQGESQGERQGEGK